MLLHARQKTGRHFRTGPVCSQEEHHVESGPPSEPLSRNLVVVSTFSMFAEIKTLALDLWADAQAGEQFGDEDCNGGATGRPDNRGDNRCRLNAKLRTYPDRTVSGAAQRRRIYVGGPKGADPAAPAGDDEGVQRLIITELRVQLGRATGNE